jgi:hypothetical protein
LNSAFEAETGLLQPVKESTVAVDASARVGWSTDESNSFSTKPGKVQSSLSGTSLVVDIDRGHRRSVDETTNDDGRNVRLLQMIDERSFYSRCRGELV